MKILDVITKGLYREGITTTQLEFFRVMDKSDIEIDIASVANHDEEIIKDFNAIGCNVIEFPDRKKELFKYIKELWKILKEKEYDIIHVHGSSSLMVIELLTARIAGVKVRIAHSRNTKCKHNVLNILLKPLFYASYTVAMSCSEDAGKWLYGDRPFHILHNGKDLNKFRYSEQIRSKVRIQFGLTTEKAICFVGNLNDQKNPYYLVDIFKATYERDKNVRFFIIGDGPLRKPVEQKVKDLGLAHVTVFTGRISNVHEVLQAMDLMLLPSKYEGLPNVVLEWQAAGLPCVVSDRITRECAITGSVHFKSIDLPAEEWANELLKLNLDNRGPNSKEYCKQLADAGYDLKINAQRLREFYFKCYKNI